jgi:hypothetical protein
MSPSTTKPAHEQEISKEQDFYLAFTGSFQGILKWSNLDTLWDTVKASEQHWYIYAIGEQPPKKPATNDELKHFIDELDGLLRREHGEEYCGIVYTDDIQAPKFIKIFDPNNIGTSCSIAKTPPLPGWILSVTPPIDLPDKLLQQTFQDKNRKRWWNKLFA